MTSKDSVIRQLTVAAYTVLTDFPESDGRFAWKTTMVSAPRKLDFLFNAPRHREKAPPRASVAHLELKYALFTSLSKCEGLSSP